MCSGAPQNWVQVRHRPCKLAKISSRPPSYPVADRWSWPSDIAASLHLQSLHLHTHEGTALSVYADCLLPHFQHCVSWYASEWIMIPILIPHTTTVHTSNRFAFDENLLSCLGLVPNRSHQLRAAARRQTLHQGLAMTCGWVSSLYASMLVLGALVSCHLQETTPECGSHSCPFESGIQQQHSLALASGHHE